MLKQMVSAGAICLASMTHADAASNEQTVLSALGGLFRGDAMAAIDA